MFSDWSSDLISQNGLEDEYSIRTFKDNLPWKVGRDFVAGMAEHLCEGLDLTKPRSEVHSKINHYKQLQILMPAIGYGLTFPLNEHEILRNCVSIYIEWLSALLPEAKASVPTPILKDPNHYSAIIINHFYYLFVPRVDQGVDEINRQAILCHRVLRTLQDIAKNSPCINEDTWQILLIFLLHINSALLSPPTLPNDAGEQLGDRVLGVLFETWLLACSKCFPPPPLWTALRENCQKWRHRIGLVDQWKRITFALTVKLLSFMYGPGFVSKYINERDQEVIPSQMTKDCIAQVWFRMLHIIGNPVDLCNPEIISKTPAFLKYAISSDLVVEPSQHPCLAHLPQIFLSAMKGVSVLVDAFLGVSVSDAVSQSTGGSFDGLGQFEYNSRKFHSTAFEDKFFTPVKGRPKSNSILHLFGPWLFEAVLFNCSFPTVSKTDSSNPNFGGPNQRSTIIVDTKLSDTDSSLKDGKRSPPVDFIAGRAEAFGTLCRIFCCKKTGEEILPVYLARFYLALKEGLQTKEDFLILPSSLSQKSSSMCSVVCNEITYSILQNSLNLFRLDLDGVLTLVPNVINVLWFVLFEHRVDPSLTSPIKVTTTSIPVLRRSAISILLSLLPIPLHFKDFSLKNIGESGSSRTYLSSQRSHLMNMICSALQLESETSNIQMLLAGLLFCVQDCSVSETAENAGDPGDNFPLASSEGADSLSTLGFENESVCSARLTSSIDTVDNASTTTIPPSIPSFLPCPDSAHGLYVRAIYLVSHYLMSTWTKDVNVSLAGLELLYALAPLKFRAQSFAESKCAVKWLCDYIVYQCSRPPQAHSKDLHSLIVAAFNCVSVWLIEHPYLLNEEELLNTVLEVIELGISGSKSKGAGNGASIYKHEKELRPVSMRVRDASEALLSCVLSQVKTFPAVQGVESLSSLLDESILLRHCNSDDDFVSLTKEEVVHHVQYFVVHNSIIIGLLEQPLGNHENPSPNVTALIRSPFGRWAWNFQLRHLPRSLSIVKNHSINLGRPLPLQDIPKKTPTSFRFFPESVDRISVCKADKSIPALDQVLEFDNQANFDHQKFLSIIDKQVKFENSIKDKAAEGLRTSGVDTECSPPVICEEFQTARLLLTQLGFLSLSGLQSKGLPNIISLDSEKVGFSVDLGDLDVMSNRNVDTLHVFFVKSGQKQAQHILNNAVGEDLYSYPHFVEFLTSLGWPAIIGKHPGWTGHISTAFVLADDAKEDTVFQTEEVNERYSFDGLKNILYWADALGEVAIIVPSPATQERGCRVDATLPPHSSRSSEDRRSLASRNSEKSDSFSPLESVTESGGGSSSFSSHVSQASSSTSQFSRRFSRQTSLQPSNNYRVFVVWLQSLDDAVTFPKGDLVGITSTGLEFPNVNESDVPVYIIFIHPLANGLFRIKLEGQLSKLNFSGPLVDDQIVSRRVLGTLVRQTALNLCRRKRLESDSYQPPHVRRKFKIQEIVQKYQSQMSESEFYTHLFSTCLR